MNVIKNETQLWFCDICEKTINFGRRLRHIISKSHAHRKNIVPLLKNMNILNQRLMK